MKFLKWALTALVLAFPTLAQAQTTRCPVTSVTNPSAGHRIVITCPAGTQSGLKAGQLIDIHTAEVVPVPPTPPPPPPVVVAPAITSFGASATQVAPGEAVTFTFSVTGTNPVVELAPLTGPVSSPLVVNPTETTVYTLTATNSAGAATPQSWTITVVAPPPPPPPPVDPPASNIWGTVTPAELGEWTAAEHDAFVIDGQDGFFYRTWHPQCFPFPSGLNADGYEVRCTAHDHGDNPAAQTNAWVKANFDVRFGYAARRHKDMPGEPNGHDEQHSGFKVFIANVGDTNDEGRVNRTATSAFFHMGSAGPKRFAVRHHSGSLASSHEYPGDPLQRVAYHILMDTGGTATVCDPRVPGPSKDVMQLNSPCLLNSQYEIWRAETNVVIGGQVVARVFQTPATFNPITILNPANPTEVVYADDPRMDASKRFPGDSWSGNRNDQRETYSQNHYLYTNGPTATDSGEYCLTPTGQGVGNEQAVQCSPDTIRAYFTPGLNTLGSKSTQDNGQFKMRVDYGRACVPNRDGVCVAPRLGIAGTTNPAKLGLVN